MNEYDVHVTKLLKRINIMASIWCENMFGYLSLDIILIPVSSHFLILQTVLLEQIMSADKISVKSKLECMFASNGAYSHNYIVYM